MCLTFLNLPISQANVCENVFLKEVALPPGYRLSPEQAQTALSLPETRLQTLALKEVAQEFKNLNYKQVQLLAEAGLSAPRNSRKTYPTEFLNLTLEGKSFNEAKLRNAFEFIAEIYPHLSENALGLIAYAIHDLPQKNAKFSEAYKVTKTEKLMEEYAFKLRNTDDYVSFGELINKNLEILIYIAVEFQTSALKDLGKTPRGDFKGALKENLRNEMSLEEKIKTVLSKAEPILRERFGYAFKGSLHIPQIRNGRKLIDKSNAVSRESYFLDLLFNDFLKIAKRRNIPDADLQMFMQTMLKHLTKSPESKEHKFIADAIDSMFRIVDQSTVITPLQLRHLIDENLASIGIDIRNTVKEHDRLLAEESEKNRPLAVYAEAPSKGTGLRVAQVSGRLLKKDKEKSNEIKTVEIVENPKEDSVDLETLLNGKSEARSDITYFTRGMQNEIHYIMLWPSLIKELKRVHEKFEPWVQSFAKGLLHGGNENIKRLHSDAGHFIYEIRLGSTGDRIIIQRDKTTKTWVWRDLVDHDSVDEYMFNNGLK